MTVDPLWSDGWNKAAYQIASPNYDDRPAGILPELIVIHSISLPPGEYENAHIKELFLNQLDWSAHSYFEKIQGLKVSSHFVIDRHGNVMQFVSCNKRAWHAGRSTWQGRDECNDWSIGIELEGLEGDAFESAQYHSLVYLMNQVCKHYPIQWVAGHEHIAPLRKQDPGTGFEWQQLISKVKILGKEAFPTEVQI